MKINRDKFRVGASAALLLASVAGLLTLATTRARAHPFGLGSELVLVLFLASVFFVFLAARILRDRARVCVSPLRALLRPFPRTFAALLFLFASGSAVADTSKISPDLLPLLSNPSGSINVIVQYNSSPQTCTASGFLDNLVCTVVSIAGGVVNTAFTLINAVSATVQTSSIISLSNQANVTYISLDRSVFGLLDYSTAAVGATTAWNSGLNGTGVGIAIIDSGIYSHPDLTTADGTHSRVVYRQSFIKGGVQYDDYGHGTHVAGIAAGNGASARQAGSFRNLQGVAPNANLLDLRVLDQNGSSNDSAVIAAIETAVKLKSKFNVRVINLSLGRPISEGCRLDPLCQAAGAAWNNGIVVVTAAGNLGRNGYATVISPANNPSVITVGSMKTMATYATSDDLIASYSSRGPTYIDLTAKPDVVAPGNLVVALLSPGCTLAKEYPANVVNPSYYTTSTSPAPTYLRLSGTSMASPVVAGTVALMLQKSPGLSPDTVKARLMKTAGKNFPLYSTATDTSTGKTYTDTYDIFTVGAGYVDVAGALNSNDFATGSSASPSVLYNPLTTQVSLSFGAGQIWGTGAWGTNVVWGSGGGASGTNVVWGSGGASGTNVVWGSNTDSGTNVVWGSNTDSGTNVVWGSSSDTTE